MKIYFKHFLERDEEEIDIWVECDCYPAERGARDRYGVQLEPDHPAEIEITSITNTKNQEIDLTKWERENIVEEAWDYLADR